MAVLSQSAGGNPLKIEIVDYEPNSRRVVNRLVVRLREAPNKNDDSGEISAIPRGKPLGIEGEAETESMGKQLTTISWARDSQRKASSQQKEWRRRRNINNSKRQTYEARTRSVGIP